MFGMGKIKSVADPERQFVEAVTAAVKAARAHGLSEGAMSRVLGGWVSNFKNRQMREIERRTAP
jgi:hypothetical protein